MSRYHHTHQDKSGRNDPEADLVASQLEHLTGLWGANSETGHNLIGRFLFSDQVVLEGIGALRIERLGGTVATTRL
jgi:hypothetical protein